MTEINTGTGGYQPNAVQTPPTAASNQQASMAGAMAKTGLGKDDFLKLLIAQLRNQDPMKPMEDREFIAQMAQFSALEATQNLSALIERNANMQTVSQAGGLVGKHIEAVYGDGSVVEGEAVAVLLTTTNGVTSPKLLVDGYEVALADIRSISGGTPDPAPATDSDTSS